MRRPAGSFIGPTEQAFRLTASDAADLATELFQRNKRTFEATVNAQLEALERRPDFRLTNGKVLKQLKKDAVATAKGIASTYNQALVAKTDAVVEAERTRGLNRATLAKRLNDWDQERSLWKSAQIQRTEAAKTATIATELFVQVSGLESEVRYRLLPGDSEYDHPDDLAAIAGEVLTSGEAQAMPLPAHPNERHTLHLAFPKQMDKTALWMGA